MAAPGRFAKKSDFSLAPRAPSIHDPVARPEPSPGRRGLARSGRNRDALGGAETPEAALARLSFSVAAQDLDALVRRSISGRESIGQRIEADVDIALEVESRLRSQF